MYEINEVLIGGQILSCKFGIMAHSPATKCGLSVKSGSCQEKRANDEMVNSAMEVKIEPNLTVQEPDKIDKEAAADSDVGSSGDDSVFEEMEESGHLERPTVVGPRTRRVSDVIDSLGSKEEPTRSMSTPERLRPRAMSVSSSGYGTPGPAADTPADWLSHSQSADVTDAQPMNQSTETPSIETKAVEATMPVEKDADEYNMNHCKRGKAVIFNHDKFDNDDMAPPRSGSHVDVDNLQKTYSALDFEVIIHDNLPYTKIKETLEELAKEDHSDEDCLVVVVLTHGLHTSYIYSRDVPYPVNILWDAFTADKCTTLAGKPKMFIIQACRGTKLDSGVLLRRPSRTEADSSPPSYKIPSHADFLIAYSSMEGFYSWRNPDKGTWFIQSLCKELLEHSATMDLLEMMTRISRRVALDYESYNDEKPWQHEQKQIPSIMTMLIRKVYFRPKV